MNWRQSQIPPLNEVQFKSWQTMLEERTGMYIPYERRSLLQSSLAIRMREVECHDYDAYFKRVQERPAGVKEWATLVDRIMVRETRFCRNSESLELVERYLKHRIAGMAEERPINIWSVGCCTGEEPYSLAITCNEAFEANDRAPKFGVSGTDISLPALQIAREGRYSRRQMSNMNPEWISRYFIEQEAGQFVVGPEIRERVCFSMSNIVDIARNPLRNLDVIYCQNVLVYFREERKHLVLDNLADRLAPGGLLVIAQGETSKWHNDLLHKVDDNLTLAFVRREQPYATKNTH
ncbi:MAG: methyltransferase [Oleiphilus sp.]|nr:MAG: methyltransferase [Oleiphilus sp.]